MRPSPDREWFSEPESASSRFIEATASPGIRRTRPAAVSSKARISDSAPDSQSSCGSPERFLNPRMASAGRDTGAAARLGAGRVYGVSGRNRDATPSDSAPRASTASRAPLWRRGREGGAAGAGVPGVSGAASGSALAFSSRGTAVIGRVERSGVRSSGRTGVITR
jgi:hypothetical protein